MDRYQTPLDNFLNSKFCKSAMTHVIMTDKETLSDKW